MRPCYLTLALILFLIAACSAEPGPLHVPVTSEPADKYQYQVGLGYGFLDKHVQVFVDGREVLSVTGTEEIEEFAQLLGTKMLAGGSTDAQEVTVQVVVDEAPPFKQVLDLSAGRYIHVYYPESGLQVYNTEVLILE